MSDKIYRINCGAIDRQVPGWLNDQEWTAGASWGYTGGGQVTREADLPIHGGELTEVIRSERFNADSYQFQLDAGIYDIRIISAITFEGDFASTKAFAVQINGVEVAGDFAPYSVSGGLARPAIIVVSGYAHSGGMLQITFSSQSVINGIEIGASSATAQTLSIEAPFKRVELPPLPAVTKKARHIKLLFIGNSGTFFWAIPETVRSLLNNSPAELTISFDKSLSGGKRFEWHYTESACMKMIKNNGYDIVVMQDSSGGPLDFTDSMKEYADKLIEAIQAAGSTPLLYAYEGPECHTSEQRMLAMQHYSEIAKKHKIRVVPGAAALDSAMQALPDTNFHNPDRHHLGMFGGYVMACCFFEVLSGINAENHAYPAVFGHEVLIPLETARILERCAHEACVAYSNY